MPNLLRWEELLKNPPESYKKWFNEERKFFKDNIEKNSKVMEVGCGNGRSLRDLLIITKDITGIDHDEKAVNDARNDLPKNVKLIVAEAEKLPFNDKSFDVVTCIGTFSNFGNKKNIILNEMKRVTRDNGFWIISVYSERALPERLKIYKRLSKDEIKEVRSDGTVMFNWDNDNISEQFSKEQLEKILAKSNLKIDKLVDAGIGYICKLIKSKN